MALEKDVGHCEKEELALVVRPVDRGFVEDHGEEILSEVEFFKDNGYHVVVIDTGAKDDATKLAFKAEGGASLF